MHGVDWIVLALVGLSALVVILIGVYETLESCLRSQERKLDIEVDRDCVEEFEETRRAAIQAIREGIAKIHTLALDEDDEDDEDGENDVWADEL